MTQSTDNTDKTDPKTTPEAPDASELLTRGRIDKGGTNAPPMTPRPNITPKPQRPAPRKAGLRDSFARLNVAIDVYRGVIDADDLAECGALKHEDLIDVLRIANGLQRAREKREARDAEQGTGNAEPTPEEKLNKILREKPPLVRTGPGGEFTRDYTPGENLDVQA